MSGFGWALFATGLFVILLSFWLGTRVGMDDTKTIFVVLLVAVGLAWLVMGVVLVKRLEDKTNKKK